MLSIVHVAGVCPLCGEVFLKLLININLACVGDDDVVDDFMIFYIHWHGQSACSSRRPLQYESIAEGLPFQ